MGNLHTSDDTENEAAISWISPACLQRKRRTTVALVYSSLQDLSHMLEQPDGDRGVSVVMVQRPAKGTRLQSKSKSVILSQDRSLVPSCRKSSD